MILPGKSERSVPSGLPEAGSKIFAVLYGVKSPRLSASVGSVRRPDAFKRRDVISQLAKKNNLFLRMGPPKVPPG